VNNNNKIILASKLNNPDIKVILIKTDRKKSSSIKIEKGKCYISVPKTLNLKEIQKIINNKYTWISKNITRQRLMPSKIVKKFENKDKILYLGKKVKLAIKKGSCSKIELIDGNLFIEHRYFSTKSNGIYAKNKTKEIIEDWYKKEALKLFTKKTHKITNELNLIVNEIFVKKYKRTWGKCSYNGNIFYNWQLIQANETIIDYVIAHEVCHLIHMNHSKDFWNSVKILDNNYKQNIEWLKNNSNLLEW
jgi:hypothetical protein